VATDTTAKNETERCARSVALTDVFPREIELNYIDGEYVQLENIGTESVDATGYVVEYEEGTEYSLPEMTMEPGSTLHLITATAAFAGTTSPESRAVRRDSATRASDYC